MIPSILRLPSLLVDTSDLDELAELVEQLATSWTVVIGTGFDAWGHELDAFVLAASLAPVLGHRPVGVAASIEAGRAASMVAREATTTQLLGTCDALLLEGDPAACHDAAVIVEALFVPGSHTVATDTAQIVDAVNDPVPSVEGGPPVLWRDEGRLRRLGDDGHAIDVGHVLEVELTAALPVPKVATLVVARHHLATVRERAAALSR